MKKFTCLALCLILVVSLFSACSKTETPATEVPEVVPTSTEAAEAETEAPVAESSTEIQAASSDKTGIPVIDSFNAFIDTKAEVFGKMQEAISADPNSFNMMMGLLEPAVMDLEMIPITFLQSADAATILGNKSCIIEGDDKDFKIAIINNQEENLLCLGKYDPSKDLLSYSVSLNNAPSSQIDYAQDHNGTYISQYYVYSTKHTIRMVFNKTDFAIGITTDDVPPTPFETSLPSIDFNYAKNEAFYVLYQDGKIAESILKQ